MNSPTPTPVSEELASFFAHAVTLADEEWERRDQEVGARREAERAERERLERLDRHQRMLDAGWPLRALKMAADAKDTPAVAYVRAWDATAKNVIVLAGAAGCGKTTAAGAWALAWRTIPRFVTAGALARTSRYEEARDQLLKAPALVLDDLGAEFLDAKGSFVSDIDELVDRFYGAERPLIITTNCSGSEFKQRYGARVLDRLRECGEWFSCSNPSLRGKS